MQMILACNRLKLRVQIQSLFDYNQETMTQKYANLIDDLQTTKRQLSNYKLNVNNLQTQLFSLENDNSVLRRTIQNLNETNAKLVSSNANLHAQKQQLVTCFNQNVEAIKKEVDRKQQQILNYQTKNFTENGMGEEFFKKQLFYEIQQQFQQKIRQKDQKIESLTKQIQRNKHQTKLQKEKFEYKTQYLEKQLKSMQNQHLNQIEQYAQKVYQQSQKKHCSQEQSMLKKLQREISQLRKTIQLKNQELQMSIIENKAIKLQYTEFVTKQSLEMEKAVSQARSYRKECERLSQHGKNNVIERDSQLIRQKQKDIRKLKNQIQELHDEITRKQRHNEKLAVQIAELTGQINKIKHNAERELEQRVRKIRSEKDAIEKEMNNLKLSYSLLKDQNMDLVKTMNNNMLLRSVSQQNLQLDRRSSQFVDKKNINSHKRLPNTNMAQFQTLERNVGGNDQKNRISQLRMIATQDKHIQEVEFNQKLQQQRDKVRDIARKYLDMKQKYEKAKNKLQIANSKILQLIRTKVALGSPTAASKKTFDFTGQKINRARQSGQHTMDPQKIKMSRQQQILHQDFYEKEYDSRDRIQERDSQVNRSNKAYQRENGEANLHKNAHMRSLNQLSRQILGFDNQTSQNFNKQGNTHKYYQRANRTISSGSRDYYERSLKIRSNHKFRQLRCENHSIKQQK